MSRDRWLARVWLSGASILWLAACQGSSPGADELAGSDAPGAIHPEVKSDEILWDTYGVPHIYGTTAESVFFGFGWAQATSHGDLVLRLYGQARARASEYWGPEYEATDIWLLKNDVPSRGTQWYDAQDAAFRTNLDAFADGINAYVKAHPDAVAAELLEVLPVTGADVVTHAHRLMNFIYVASPTRVLGPRAAAPAAGSNAYAIAPHKTEQGHTLLLQNPHLPWSSGYFTYYEAHLRGPDFEMYGATQVGLPVIRFAFNRRMGITNTVNSMLGATTYRLEIAEDGYLLDGSRREFVTQEKTYRVKQADGRLQTKSLSVRSSVHGPVFERADGTQVALRVAGLDRPGMLQQYFDMLRAESFEAYQAVMARLQVPTFNVLYADREGHIQYVSNGVLPERSSGDLAFWQGLVPGDRSEYLWDDVHPWQDLPRVSDPASGFVQNANDAPWLATFPPSYEPSDFPSYVAPRGPMSLRAQNSVQRMLDEDRVSFDELLAIKLSAQATALERVLPDLELAAEESQDADVARAMALLREWNGEFDRDAEAALLFEELMLLLTAPQSGIPFANQANYAVPWAMDQALSTPRGIRDGVNALEMLEEAIANTKSKYGRIDRPFGEVSRFQIGEKDLPGLGGYGNLGAFNVVTWADFDGDGIRTPAHGETWVAAVEFSDPVRARGYMTYGNSRQPGSNHRSDQIELLAEGKFRTLWLSREDVEANTASREELSR